MRFWPQREPGQDIGFANPRATKMFLIGLAAVSVGIGIVFAAMYYC